MATITINSTVTCRAQFWHSIARLDGVGSHPNLRLTFMRGLARFDRRFIDTALGRYWLSDVELQHEYAMEYGEWRPNP